VKVTLDRYVAKIVAGSWLASLAFFLFLSILMDLLNNLPLYIDRADKQHMSVFELLSFLAGYYLQQTPQTYTQMAPFVTVIACMFAVARLMAQNEIVPMLFVGRSMARILRPAVFCSLFAGGAMALCWQWVVPALRDSVSASSGLLTGANVEVKGVALQAAGRPEYQFYAVRYHHLERSMGEVLMLISSGQPGDNQVVEAKSAVWDAAAADWRLEDGWTKDSKGSMPRVWLGVPAFTPDRVYQAGKESLEASQLSYDDLLGLMRTRPLRQDVKLEFHRHITYPLANLVLLLLALPFAVYFERGSRIERVLGAIGVCAAYLVVDLTCQSLGSRELLHPIVAAWLPTILFGSLGVVMFGSMRT
jgi:lipopolysaccharide export LptBFGC system permease protein LptF